jgi:hypothetical protein
VQLVDATARVRYVGSHGRNTEKWADCHAERTMIMSIPSRS